MFKIGDKLTKENYTQGAIWGNNNNAEVKLISGEYVLVAKAEPLPPTREEQQKARANAYASEVDPLMSEYTRKKTFNLFEEGEEALLAEIEVKVQEIKARYPYPVEPIEEIEELPVVKENLTAETETVDIVD